MRIGKASSFALLLVSFAPRLLEATALPVTAVSCTRDLCSTGPATEEQITRVVDASTELSRVLNSSDSVSTALPPNSDHYVTRRSPKGGSSHSSSDELDGNTDAIGSTAVTGIDPLNPEQFDRDWIHDHPNPFAGNPFGPDDSNRDTNCTHSNPFTGNPLNPGNLQTSTTSATSSAMPSPSPNSATTQPATTSGTTFGSLTPANASASTSSTGPSLSPSSTVPNGAESLTIKSVFAAVVMILVALAVVNL